MLMRCPLRPKLAAEEGGDHILRQRCKPHVLPARSINMARVHEAHDLKVGIVGCGRMGCAIAGEFVRRGCSVILYDHTEYTRNRAFQTLRASLWDHVANGYLLKQDVEELMGRIGVAETLDETLEKSEVVIESVFEDAALKRDLFNNMAAKDRCSLEARSRRSLPV